jgi:signal transduction histidine kinase
MRYSLRSLIAVVLTVVAAVGGMTAWALDKVDPGMTYGWGADAHGRNALTIGEVRPGGLAWYQGAHPGDIIINVGGVMTLPGDDAVLETLVNSQPDKDFYAVAPADLPQVLANGGLGGPVQLIDFTWAPRRLTASGVALLAGFLICLLGFLWRRWASPGPALSRILPSVICASATPLFLVPAYYTLNPLVVILVGVLVAGAALLAAVDAAAAIEPTALRREVLLSAFALAAAAAVVGGVAAFTNMERSPASQARWALLSATVLVPGLLAARSLRRPAVTSQLGRTVDSIEVGTAATLPAFALVPLGALSDPPFATPLVAWVVVVVALRVFAIRPMARLATQTAMERELIVDDSEAERRRIAGDIHDDVIQDLTMLVHRLDREGATEPADTVRQAIDRLRAICADLRLPVLDDLGLGPAIHSLVGELEPEAGGEMRLKIEGESRLPADVELTLFRIVQEGLANAVKHGRPPIDVRLGISSGRAEVTIDDSGPGIPDGVLTAAPAEGHMGLLSMTQRAQQIGADLAFEARPEGGTRVRLVWTAEAAQAARAQSQVERQAAN